jgi:imidazoleglycerol-phosphate dehydratase
MRSATIERNTHETEIRLSLNLDGSGRSQLNTGIGFLDHMLNHIAVHGLFDLDVQARGDLHVDVHHTVEDVALTLGLALDQALGQRLGIIRAGSCYMPMDESLALVALDLSGRPYSVIQVPWRGLEVGGIPLNLFEHFFQSLAVTGKLNLHIQALYGRDDHHLIEACFKAFGRALDAAVQIDPRRQQAVPSTKGTLI